MEALVRYFHAAVGFPVRDTWLRAIKCGNYSSFPGLTYANADIYCPYLDETIMVHIVQDRQGVRSTKPKLDHSQTITSTVVPPSKPSWELYIHIEHISKLYTYNTGRFPIRSRSGNQYLMIAYYCDSNAILVVPFKSHKYSHQLLTYNEIMTRLKQRNQFVYLQIVDNEASAEYKATMQDICKV